VPSRRAHPATQSANRLGVCPGFPIWVDHYGCQAFVAISELPFLYRRMFKADKRHRFFLNSWGPSGAWWFALGSRARSICSWRIRSLRQSPVDGRVRLRLTGPAGATDILTDHVVAATGFDVALERIDCLDPTLRAQIAREGRHARLNANFETSVKGLFSVGLAAGPIFGPVQRLSGVPSTRHPWSPRPCSAAPPRPNHPSRRSSTDRWCRWLRICLEPTPRRPRRGPGRRALSTLLNREGEAWSRTSTIVCCV
jgi:hypothetical protein